MNNYILMIIVFNKTVGDKYHRKQRIRYEMGFPFRTLFFVLFIVLYFHRYLERGGNTATLNIVKFK